MQYKAAKQCTQASPCTNSPIHCTLCSPTLSGDLRTIWSYNLVFHLASEHLSSGGLLPKIPPQLWINAHISKLEEERLKIDGNLTKQYRNDWGVPNTDALEALNEEVDQVAGTVRMRSATTSTVQSDCHQSKRARGGSGSNQGHFMDEEYPSEEEEDSDLEEVSFLTRLFAT